MKNTIQMLNTQSEELKGLLEDLHTPIWEEEIRQEVAEKHSKGQHINN